MDILNEKQGGRAWDKRRNEALHNLPVLGGPLHAQHGQHPPCPRPCLASILLFIRPEPRALLPRSFVCTQACDSALRETHTEDSEPSQAGCYHLGVPGGTIWARRQRLGTDWTGVLRPRDAEGCQQTRQKAGFCFWQTLQPSPGAALEQGKSPVLFPLENAGDGSLRSVLWSVVPGIESDAPRIR